ncbi:DEAD/DEAH box helicase [Thermoflavimicrobium dichotomicum]|nr:DEAD/DEAH box helicase [Thermoflavimicrobium dichotomicum]
MMTDRMLNQLHEHMERFRSRQTKEKLLIIFQGFDETFLTTLPYKKLVSAPLNQSIQALAQAKANLLPEVFQVIGNPDPSIYWATYEEYITLGKETILPLYFDLLFLRNNLFDKMYPCCYQIENDKLMRQYLETNEYLSDEEMPEGIHNVLEYYGEIRTIDGKLFISYTELPQNVVDFFIMEGEDVLIDQQSVYQECFLELSEDEEPFLSFLVKLTSGQLHQKKIVITYSGDLELFPHAYKKRLRVIQSLYRDQVQIVLTTKKLDAKPVPEERYLEILKKYWGYDSFRKLKMYRDVNETDKKKETIEISQGQIIDDLVQQAERAYQGQSYQDIFVTSPTGAGKSIMFQIPAIYLAQQYGLMTIVISPLIGLMTDQVQGLHNKNIDISATINSNLTPVEKQEIIEKIKAGQISILYISPETLLSRSDISDLIGERQIGLFVIDEAHIVTTWGKAFRSDYWYLGAYLQKLRKELPFPVATFTATAIYGGLEDMYAETRDSLGLIHPISYFGYIKRENIQIRIQQKEMSETKFKEYLDIKYKVLLFRLNRFLERREKTLVYFPMVRLIHEFLNFARSYGSKELVSHLCYYYGSLSKEKKNTHYLRFKNNESLIMLATKAFGMGIDIPDIRNVYHFAPTGNVCDYVQEIGRAARHLDKGYAYFDFLSKDFVHVKRLHGISTLRKQQLVQVVRKILNLAQDSKGQMQRNLLVSSDEFRYIFESSRNLDQVEDVDNKLKTALLIIEKDFKAKLNYSPIIARPRSLFTKEYFQVEPDVETELMQKYGRYFSRVSDYKGKSIIVCNLKELWQDYHPTMSFAQFKYFFHTKDPCLEFDFLHEIHPILFIDFSLSTRESTFLKEFGTILRAFNIVLGKFAQSGKYFTIEQFTQRLAHSLGKQMHKDKYYCENIATVFLTSAEAFERLNKKYANFYRSFLRMDEDRKRFTVNSNFSSFTEWLEIETQKILRQKGWSTRQLDHYEIYLSKKDRQKTEKSFLLFGLLEAMGLLVYSVIGGDNPEIYIRINSFYQLKRVVDNPDGYHNIVLSNVYERHRTSVDLLTHLFQKEVSTEVFWELIEDYFLGASLENILKKLDAIA